VRQIRIDNGRSKRIEGGPTKTFQMMHDCYGDIQEVAFEATNGSRGDDDFNKRTS
jgi:hypothetical protein